MDDFGFKRRSLLISGLGASAVTGSSPVPPSPADDRALASLFPSVTDYGALGNGAADDAVAFQRALSASAGGMVTAPARRGGYRLNAPVTIPPDTTLWFIGEGQQRVLRAHDGDLFVLQSGARVIGGDFDGGGRRGTGSGFLFAPGTGQQSLERVRATRGWRAPILRYVGDGGSQSRVADFSLNCDAGGDRRPYAVAMEAGSARGAAPRHFQTGEFNGAPSFDFDGCSVVTVNGVYCGPLRFTDTSRGVMLSDSRVGNQPTLEIRGSNHVLIAGWYPRLTLAPGADNCLVSGFFNSGYVRDLSGNARNLVDFWPHQVTPIVQAGGRALSVAPPFQAAIARSGATYTYRFGMQLDLRQLGSGALELALPEAVSTSAATDQWGTGMLQMEGSSLWETLALRVLPKGERRAIAVFAGGHPLGARAGVARLSGTVSFSA